jgi:hypothetical protein
MNPQNEFTSEELDIIYNLVSESMSMVVTEQEGEELDVILNKISATWVHKNYGVGLTL